MALGYTTENVEDEIVMFPTINKEISYKTTELSGFAWRNGQLYRNNQKLTDLRDEVDGMNCFVKFLEDTYPDGVHLVVHGDDILTLCVAALRCGVYDRLNKIVLGVFNSQIFMQQEIFKQQFDTKVVGLKNLIKNKNILKLLRTPEMVEKLHDPIVDSKIVQQIVESGDVKEMWSDWLIKTRGLNGLGLGRETLESAYNRVFYDKKAHAYRKGNSQYLTTKTVDIVE